MSGIRTVRDLVVTASSLPYLHFGLFDQGVLQAEMITCFKMDLGNFAF